MSPLQIRLMLDHYTLAEPFTNPARVQQLERKGQLFEAAWERKYKNFRAGRYNRGSTP